MKKNYVNKKKSFLSKLSLYLVITVILITLFIGNYFFIKYKTYFQILIFVLVTLIILYNFLITGKIKFIKDFLSESMVELHKIVWPSRKETIYTTLIVTLVTLLISLVLWVIDNILVRMVSFLIKLRFN